jgi:hypothetical protein
MKYLAYTATAASFAVLWFLFLSLPISPASAAFLGGWWRMPLVGLHGSVFNWILLLAASNIAASMLIWKWLRGGASWRYQIPIVLLFPLIYSVIFGFSVWIEMFFQEHGTGKPSANAFDAIVGFVYGSMYVITYSLCIATLSYHVELPISALQIWLLGKIVRGNHHTTVPAEEGI